jgi:hypothetical protein
VWLYNTPISEDCLYLSVTRPAHKSATPLPVMVGLFVSTPERRKTRREREEKQIVVLPVLSGYSLKFRAVLGRII